MSDDSSKIKHPAAAELPPDENLSSEEEMSDADDELVAEKETCDVPPMPTFRSAASASKAFNQDGSVRTIIKARKSAFVNALVHLDGKRFDFTGREYLLPIYDRNDPEALLKTARQVEKCCSVGSLVSLSDGRQVVVENLLPGDSVSGFSSDGRCSPVSVVGSESNGARPCLAITTRLGNTIKVTHNHPVLCFDGWIQASQLSIGKKIASPRTIGAFGNKRERLAALLGLIAGDGCFVKTGNAKQFSFTVANDEVELWFRSLVKYAVLGTYPKKNTKAKTIHLSVASPLARWFESLGFYDKRAWQKVLPDEVFSYDEESTRELLRGLWATDGHCKNVTNSKVDLVFCSTSKDLAMQTVSLLRKFGVLSVVRENKPKSGRLAYIVRVVTRRSIEAFYYRIGPIPGKPFDLPTCKPNSNLDTLPKEAHQDLQACRKKCGDHWSRHGLGKHGLRQNFEYCLTYEKARLLQKFVRSPKMEWALSSDIFWDEITSIEYAGIEETWAVQTTNETYICQNLVNHNSTYLANNLTVSASIRPYNKALYVSPSHSQTRQFSNEKLKAAIDGSPIIQKYLQDHQVSSQVFEKGFTNGSYIFLRSAFRTADRARGISARQLCLDELQDFLISQIPVIKECTSHFPDATVLMAGTPKSFDNPIEVYWKETTQNEWLVPCPCCGKWNFLDEKCIAPTQMYVEDKLPPGPVCSKCMKPLDVTKGRWVSMSPSKAIQGYRIPQIMVPWICGIKEQWLKLLWKRDNYPFGQFSNEVLGLSYDSASKPITRDELIECCAPYSLWNPSQITPQVVQEAHRLTGLCAGVDWGEGNDGSEKSPSGKLRTASYTVLTIGAYINQKVWKTFLIKKYTGREIDPDFVVADIARLCQVLGVKVIGVDWGHGWGVNNVLVRKFGTDKVIQFQHLPKLKQRLKWDPLGFRYHLSRNFMMSELFFDLKHKLVQFPRWAEFEPYSKDILSIYAEYSEFRREIRYDHRASDPDDGFHSLLYAKLVTDLYLGKSRRYTKDVVHDGE